MTLLRATAVLCLCLNPAFARAQASPAKSALAITEVTLVDGTGSGAQRGKTVVIVGNRIDAIVDASAKASIPKGARTVSGKGLFLIPGLWDMHVHLHERDLPLLVAHGVTGVRDMGNILSDVDSWRARIAAGVMIGPQIVRVGPILNGKSFGPAQVGALFLILGALDIWRGIAPVFTSGHLAPDDAEVLAIGIAAVVGGIGVLRGMNWARWLLAVWTTLHVVISVGQPKQFVGHLVIFGSIAYLLFRRRASGFFVR